MMAVEVLQLRPNGIVPNTRHFDATQDFAADRHNLPLVNA